MSKYIENINTLHNNIFALTPLLVTFYKNMPKRDKNILYAYFVFPIVLHNWTLENVKRITASTPLNRFTGNKEFMAGFEERFKFYKDITNRCMQYAIECNYIEIDANLAVTVLDCDYMQFDPQLNKSRALALQLFNIFRKNIQNTYILFGIKEL